MARAKRSKKDLKKINEIVVILIIISIVLGILIYNKSGQIGLKLSPALGGALGFIKYFLPVGLFIVAINIAYEKDSKAVPKKLILFFIALILIDCILACYQISEHPEMFKNKEFKQAMTYAYDLGRRDIGGGVLGTSIAYGLSKLFGIIGAIVISIGGILVIGVKTFELAPADAIANLLERMKDRKAENADRKIEEQKEREEEREEEREKRKREREERRELARKEKEEAKEEARQLKINLNSQKDKKSSKDDFIKVPNINRNNKVSKLDDSDLFVEKKVEKEEKSAHELQLQHTVTEADIAYEFPPVNLLKSGPEGDTGSKQELLATAEKLRKTLYSFGVSTTVENVSVGPAITRYEISPAEGVRVSKIANLSDDIALALEAETIRIEAPIPGKGTVGIEVPNKNKTLVALRDIIESKEFQDKESNLAFALGKDVAGDLAITDISKMPHLLIAGSTGSGKSVCINTMIASIIYKAKPNEVKLLMIDPKVVELSVYNGIPHLLIPVVTDPRKAAGALQWAVMEMTNRYKLFADKKVRDIKGYNKLAASEGNEKLPDIVIIIDELADLMMVASKEVEDAICRLAQMARAAGMYLVIATQRPSVDVITGIIKANIPSRIAFAVSSQIDSRTILDQSGAEKLLGKGDMLFHQSGTAKPVRLQGAFISDTEVENIVKFIKTGAQIYDEEIIKMINEKDNPEQADGSKDAEAEDDTDPLLEEAIEQVIEEQRASASYIQRKFKVGYARAGRIIDQMEERGIISGYQGSKPRDVLMSKERWQELNMSQEEYRQNTKNVEDNYEEETENLKQNRNNEEDEETDTLIKSTKKLIEELENKHNDE